MTQHLSLVYKPGSQTRQYSGLMISFLTAWVVLAVVVWIT